MSQPCPTQHLGFKNMQFWEQQLMYKHLQELQRQQQLQQQDQVAIQQNSLRQMSAAIKPVSMNQLPLMMSDIATNDLSNYMWPNNLNGSLPTMPNNSQILNAGNMNWVQSSCSPTMQNVSSGHMISSDQDQAMRSRGFIHQQLDTGTPVSSYRGSINQYIQYPGISNDGNNLMTKASANHAEKVSDPYNSYEGDECFPGQGCLQDRMSVATKNLQGKGLFGNNPSQGLSSDVSSGNFLQSINLQSGFQVQEIQNRKEQRDWSGNLQEKQAEQGERLYRVPSLDPTEEKILFGSEDGDSWGASLTGNLNSCPGGYLNGIPLANDLFGGLPSIQSGSWSALMQEAVQASSSEKGLQEEWSGTDFQKMKQSMVGYSGKDLAVCNDGNMQRSSKPLLLLDDSDAGPSTYNAPGFQQSFQSAHDGNNSVQTDVSHASFQLFSSDANIMQLHQIQKQQQVAEDGLQAQMPETNVMWPGQTYGKHEDSSSDLRNLEGGWTHQKGMPLSDVAMKSGNRPSASYPVESCGVSNSNLTDSNGIMWRLGGSRVNPNGRVQPVTSDLGSSQVQTEGISIGNHGSVMSSNNLKLNTEISQQDTNSQQVVFGKTFPFNNFVNCKANESVGRNQNRPSGIPSMWESSLKNADAGLHDYFDRSKEQNVVSSEGYVSSNSNCSQQCNIGNDTKESSTSSGYDPNSFACGNQKSPTLSAQQTLGPNVYQNQMSNLGMNVEPSFPTSHQAHAQDLPNSVFQGSKSEEQTYGGKLNFSTHYVSDNNVDRAKGCVMGVDELQSRNVNLANAFNSFGGSTSLYSVNKNASQTSQNMLELLHKVDQSRSSSAVSASEMPAQAAVGTASTQFNQPFAMQGFNLRLAPPSQRQQLPHFALHSQTVNSGKTRLFDQDSGDKDQQTRHVSGHEAVDQSVNFAVSDQTNVSPSVKDASFLRQQHGSHDGSVAGNSTQAFSTPASRVPASRVAPFVDSPAPSSSKSYSAESEIPGRIIVGFPQAGNLGPVPETRSGPQPPPGMSRTTGFSKMFQNVWTSISAQQRLAGLQPNKLTPQVLQSGVPQKQDNQGAKHVLASSEFRTSHVDSQNGEEHASKGSSLKSTRPEKIDSGPNSGIVHQGQGFTWKSPSDGGSNASIPSLVRSYQQDMDKGKGSQDSALHSLAVHGSNRSFPSSSIEFGFSGHASLHPDVQQQNYSLLQQMQVMKGTDSNQGKVSGQKPEGAEFSSNASRIDHNTGLRQFYGQSTGTRIPPDGKAGAYPQNSFQADEKMMPFASKGNEGKNPSIPCTVTAGQHGLQNLVTSSAANLIGGSDRTKISPQMAPSWFEKYGTYKNGTMTVAKSDGQWAAKPASHPYFFTKVPGSMDQSTVVNQINDSSQIGTHGQSILPASATAHESSLQSPLPTIVDHGMVPRSNKRKNATLELVPWHKKVTQGQQRLRSVSMAELDWAQAANRLIEKVGDDVESIDHGLSVPMSRRRLILTTQLMQHLLPAAPARMLNIDATSAYDSVTFYVAKAALADACSLISSSGRDSWVNAEREDMTSEELKPPEKQRAHMFSKISDNFIQRSRKLENDFLRLERRTSVLDVRFDCQDLERMSIINRLGKFHGRPNTDLVEGSSSSETANRRTFPQTYVTALSVPGNLPEGVQCLSL